MKNNRITWIFLLVCTASIVQAQFGVGITYGGDFYQRYTNPEDGIADPSSGSAILNSSIGPKIWLGGKDVSLSVEAQVNWGIIGLDRQDFKGLGHLSFPLLANINFGRTSGLSRQDGVGFSLGGGIQYNRTELYGLDQEYIDLGVTREYFPTYIIQAAIGTGISGFAYNVFVRYGFQPDGGTGRTLNIGSSFDMNFLKMREIDDPASRL